MRVRAALRSRLPTVLSPIGVAVLAIIALPFAVDDAFIVLRYADNLAGGGGWAMNAGSPTDGVTGPLWVLPLAAASALGCSPLLVAEALGVVAGGSAVVLAVRRVGRRSGGRRGAWVTLALLAVAPQLAIWCMAGLETGVATLFVIGAALAATARPKPRPWLLGISVALLAGLRPELALFALTLLVGVALRERRSGLIAFALSAAGALLIVAVRLAVFDDPLPLSFYAKPSDVSVGASYAVRGAMVITGASGALVAASGAYRGRRDDRLIALSLVAHLVAVALAGGDWMPGFRLLAPMVPLYALLAGVAFTRPLPRQALRSGALALGLMLALAVPALDAWVQLPRARAAGAVREGNGAELARYLAAHGESVALVDIGYLGYASGLEVVDLGGVTDPVVAHARGGHTDKIIDVGHLASRDPDLIVFSSRAAPEIDEEGHVRLNGAMPVEYRLAATAWLRSGYRVAHVAPYGDAHYVVLRRR